MSRIFLAGGTGIIGQSLVPLLRGAGHFVVGTTRSGEGKAKLEAMGIDAVIINVFDAEALRAAVTAAAPDVLIHQLTDLAAGIDPAAPEEAIRRNAHLRREGTANVVAAARTAGVKRIIAQSIAWAFAPKPLPFIESDPLDVNATGSRAISIMDGIVPLENAVLDQNDFEGFVLRYGQLYGPGTGLQSLTAQRRCTSRLPPMPRSLQSIMAGREPTISQIRAVQSRSTGRSANWAGGLTIVGMIRHSPLRHHRPLEGGSADA